MWESKYTRNVFENESSYLAHHGILGQKWGVRRFQNEDGSLTAAGEKRYGTGSSESKPMSKREQRKAAKVKAKEQKVYNKARDKNINKAYQNAMEAIQKEIEKLDARYEKEVGRENFKYSSKAQREYYEDVELIVNKYVNEELDKLIGKDPSGKGARILLS